MYWGAVKLTTLFIKLKPLCYIKATHEAIGVLHMKFHILEKNTFKFKYEYYHGHGDNLTRNDKKVFPMT